MNSKDFDTVELETQRELESLLTEFGRLVDNGRADQVHELFTSDGSIRGPGLAMQTQAEIREKFTERAADKNRVSRHFWSNPYFERVDEETIRLSTVVQTFVHSLAEKEQLPAPANTFVVGDSVDVFKFCSDKKWRFQSRELTVIFRN